jgi:two-component system sensor histidine kinase/response regulator
MNLKQSDFPKNFKSVGSTPNRESRSAQSSGMSTVISATGNASQNHLMIRLQEIEEHNARLEKLVKQSTKKLSDVVATNTKFISILAHDLRSPFTSILGALELLKTKLDNNNGNDAVNYVDIAFNSAIKTLSLLDNLLAWTISQNEEKNFNPVRINLHELIADEIDNSNTSAIQKRLIMNHSIAPDLNVTADLQMVKTILRNLINNAIKYTNTGGQINISASGSKQFVEIAVRDTGIGISKEAQSALFKTNTFNSTAGTDSEQGAGLGLLLCKEFVEMHGGNIRIESEPGKGSIFKFTLPHYI